MMHIHSSEGEIYAALWEGGCCLFGEMIDECKRNAYRLRECNKVFLLMLVRVVCVSAAEELSRRADDSCLFLKEGSAPFGTPVYLVSTLKALDISLCRAF